MIIYSTTPKKVASQLHIDRNRNSEDCADPKPIIVKGEIPTDFSPLHQSNSSAALLQADLLPGVVDQFRAEIAEFRDELLFYFCFFSLIQKQQQQHLLSSTHCIQSLLECLSKPAWACKEAQQQHTRVTLWHTDPFWPAFSPPFLHTVSGEGSH